MAVINYAEGETNLIYYFCIKNFEKDLTNIHNFNCSLVRDLSMMNLTQILTSLGLVDARTQIQSLNQAYKS